MFCHGWVGRIDWISPKYRHSEQTSKILSDSKESNDFTICLCAVLVTGSQKFSSSHLWLVWTSQVWWIPLSLCSSHTQTSSKWTWYRYVLSSIYCHCAFSGEMWTEKACTTFLRLMWIIFAQPVIPLLFVRITLSVKFPVKFPAPKFSAEFALSPTLSLIPFCC